MDAGQQLDPAERLRQVVVGPGVEAADLVAFGGERGQHEDGHVAHVADAFEDLPPVEVGHPHVEDHQVRLLLMEEADAVAAQHGLGDGEPFALEHRPQELSDVGFVLNDEN